LSEEIKTTLFCLHCAKETPHTIVYSGQYLRKIRCRKCNIEVQIDKEKILQLYTSDILERILSKPERLTEEVRKDISSFLLSMPFRIVSKPYRIAKEVLEIMKNK